MSTFQPPIHLDPNQDSTQQIAFINQNFQSLASALETNSFRIVNTIQGTINTPDINPGAGVWAQASSTNSIAHGLSFTPFLVASSTVGGSSYIPLSVTKAFVTGGAPFWVRWSVTSDATNINFIGDVTAFGIHVLTSSTPVKVFLLQITSN